MQSLSDIKWRNSNIDGYLVFTVKVSSGPRERGDYSREQVEAVAVKMRETLESRGFTVRIEHVRQVDV